MGIYKKSKAEKEELIEEVINGMKGDIYNYEEVIFDLVKVGLKKWTITELKEFLGVEREV